MRKFYTLTTALILILFFLCPAGMQAQVSSYNFSQSTGTYTALSAGATTLYTSTDDAVSGNITIPFTFTYSGTGYTGCKISTNGFLTLGTGTTPSTTVYTPVSNTGAAYNTAIAGLGRDLSTTVKYQTLGSSPNRSFVVEWSGYRLAVGSAESINFQVKLYETSNIVEVQYGTISTTNTVLTTGTCEVGLKSAAAVYNNVTLTNAALTGYSYTNSWNSLVAGAAQSDIVAITSTVLPASGSRLIWTPSACAQVTTAATASSITSSSAIVSWTNSATYASGYKIRWRKVDETNSVSTWATPVSVAAGTSTYTISGLAAATYYVYSIEGQCSASSANNYSPVTTSNTTNGKGLFMTTCAALNVPYTQNFDGVTAPAIPSCMLVENTNADAYAWKTCTSTSLGNATAITPVSGTNQMGIAYNSSAAMNDWFFLPAINLTAGTSYRLSFYVRGYTGLTEQIEVKYGTSAVSGSMNNTILATTSITGGVAYTQMTIDFTPSSSNAYYVGFHGLSAANQWYLFVDDINLSTTPTSLSATALTGFGNLCINNTAGPNSFTITGTLLTNADVTVGPLTGYTFSTTAGGTYTSSLTLSQPGGSYSQQVFVKFNPTLVQSYNGNIAIGGGGAATINVAASGSGVNTIPTVTAGAVSGITTTGATVAGTISATGCSSITAYGIEFSTTNGFANGSGTAVASSNLSGGNFSSVLGSLTPGTVYYFHTYATNSGGTAYSTQGTFTTVCTTVSLPHSQGFNNTVMPPCWSSSIVAVQTASKLSFVTTASNQTASPSEGADFVMYNSYSSTNGGAGSEERLISVPISTVGTTYAEVKFDWFESGNTTYTNTAEGVTLEWSTNGTTWNTVSAFPRFVSTVSTSGAWSTKSIILPAGAGNQNTLYVGFRFHSEFGYNCYLDKFQIQAVPACSTPVEQPIALNLTSITSTGLVGSFTGATPAASGYIVLRSTTNTVPTLTNGTVYTVGNSYTISGVNYTIVSNSAAVNFTESSLTANTQYYYFIFSYNSSCGGQPYYLNTAPLTGTALTCTAAAATLTGSGASSTSAIINFSTITGASSYILQYSVAGANSWIIASPAPTSSPYLLSGLTPGTAYDIRIEGPNSNCGTVKTTSNAFTTMCTSITSLPWTENFDAMPSIGSSIVPSCWLNVTGTKPFVSANASYTTYNDPASGANYMTIAYSNSTASYLWTPGFQLFAGINYDFSFKWAGDGLSGWTGDVLYNSSQNATGATLLGNFVSSGTTTSSAYTNKTFTFSVSTTGVYYFATRVSSSVTPWYLGLDDYQLKVTPACNFGGTATAASNSICGGSGSTTLSAVNYSVYGAGLAYQWQVSADNITFTDLAGQTNPASAPTGTITATRYYRLRVYCTSLGYGYSNVVTVNVGSYSITGTTPATRCGIGTVTLNATATPGSTISWYSSPVGGLSIGTGNNFNTPEISSTTNYYVGANNGTAAATIGATYSGSLSNSINVGSHGIVINTTSPNIVIVSAKIPFTGKGTFTIQLQTTGGTVVSSVTTDEITGGASVPVTVPLNIAVTTPGTYRLLVTAITGTIDELGYINNATYPYTGLGGAFSVIAGYWYGNTSSNNMYLFSLAVTDVCESGRTLVTATVTPAPALTLSSNAATICSGSSTSINVTSSLSDFSTYSWSPSTGTAASGTPLGSTVTLSPTGTTNYTLTATSASNCVNKVSVLVTVNAAPPTTTGAAVCSGSNATISAGTACATYGNPTTQINGSWNAATDPVALRPIIYIANSPTCLFDATVTRNYTTQDFQVTVTGSYTFGMPNTSAFDGMGYIVTGPFVPGTCSGGGTWIVGDDDSGPTTFEPLMTATLTAGVIYTLITTTYSDTSGTVTNNYTWNITGPTGGAVTTVSGGILQWYTVPSGGTSISSASPFNPVGAAGSGITSNTQVGSYVFYAACSNNPACRTATGYVIGAPGQWNGSTDNVWSNTLNWCGGVPTIATDATISLGAPNMPVLGTGTGTVNNLTVNNGASLTISNAKMQIAGSITATNTITASAGTVELVGSSTQTISGSSFTGRAIQNLIASNSVNVSATAGDSLKITGALSFGNVNNKAFNSNNNVILVSNAAGTARVADITNNGVNSGNTFAGKFVVQRYIPARRSWRLMTAPITAGAQTINQAWQEGVGGTWSADPSPGYGTHITGGPSRTTIQGFDQGPKDPSIFGYSGTNWNYLPTTTSELVSSREGWMLFVRGSRAINLPLSTTATVPDATTLRPTGTIRFGTQPAITNATGGFTVVGNPYPSPINFKTISKTGVVGGVGGNAYYVWDPYLGGSNGVGAFVTLAWNGTSYDKSIVTGTGSSNINTNGTIPSGSAIMINFSAGGNITVAEKDKDTVVYQNSYAFRPSTARSSVRTALYFYAANGERAIADGNLISIDANANTAIDNEDARKINNFAENICTYRDGTKIAIERRALLELNDTIFYSMWNMRQKNYELEIALTAVDIPAGAVALLEDTYLGVRSNLGYADTTRYGFAVTADAASAAHNRFRIVIVPSGVVPVTFIDIKAYQQHANIMVEWTVANEINIAGYEIEKSADGVHFSSVGRLAATGGNTPYHWPDEHAFAGDNFYRISSIDNSGIIKYSSIVKVNMRSGSPSVSVYPNPVAGNSINLLFSNMKAGVYDLKLFNATGQLVYSSKYAHAGGNASHSINTKNKLAAGVYELKLQLDKTSTYNISIIVQ